ncbi:zonular occludens toxin domain-containing protein [Acinetobacter haemolyticus]|uniref:zonular occludens toxin domain-containing protein n=1 Tax=Acinetobacter haemolyticus TaxID=29430 RepID=UPI000D689769|nr:zonular occludens toxin domain-containing protein [Acinetobacter haemolyticus]
MPVLLVTGKMGQGKTHMVMKKWVNEAVKSGRPVYTNIDGCTLDVKPIPENENGELDWLLTPESNAETGQKGALIVYDEAQRQVDKKGIRYFAWAAREKISSREVIRELEYHRHSGRDIIFITQSPKLLHLHLLELVNEHYHCTRLRNEKRSQVSLWRSWQEKPDSLAATERAEDVFFENFDEEVFSQYKSTEEVTDGKTRIPGYFWKLGVIAAVCFLIAGGLLINGFMHFSGGKRIGQDAVDKTLEAQKQLEQRSAKNAPVSQQTSQISPELQVKINDCVKQFGWSPEMCREGLDKEYLETKNKQLEERTGNSMERIVVDYNPNKPFDPVVTGGYQVTAMPVFSGCMKKDGKYIAYTQQGTILHDVSDSDCRKVIDDGDRPFNYFAQQQQQSMQTIKNENSSL